MKNHTPTNRGFTLIEIIVSLAVFIVVAVIAVGAFLKILDANKQSQSLETAMTNANFALDSMVRDLRVGETYDCYDGTNNASPSSISNGFCPDSPFVGTPTQGSPWPTIAFYSSQSTANWISQNCPLPPIHAYRYNPTTQLLEKWEQTSCNQAIGATPFIPLTSTGFKIQSFGLSVDPTGQPKVFVYMQAIAGSSAQNQTIFTVQTTASQRIMNN